MNEFLLWLLGKSDIVVPEGGRMELVWIHRPHSWMVFVMIAVVGAVLYGSWRLYSRENDACPRFWRRLLGLFRAGALVILALVLMGPALVISIEKSIEPWVFLVIDDSLSMSIRDRFPNDDDAARVANALGMTVHELRAKPLSRAEIVNRLMLRNDQRFVEELSAKGKVRIFTFSSKVRLRETIGMKSEDEDAGEKMEKGEPVPPLNPQGPATNIARGMRDALRSVSGGRAAAIVLITDGQNTTGDDPAGFAGDLREEGIPVLAAGIGDPRPPRNLRLADLWLPESVFRGDPVKIDLTVDAEGLDGESVEVELLERKVSDEGADSDTVVTRKTLQITGKTQNVSMQYQPDKSGKFILTVRIPEQQGELLATDNERSAVISVTDEKMRVLLVSGSPNWNYRLARNLLQRERTVNLSCWLQSMDSDMLQEGDTPIKRLPDKPEELFKYDVVLLFDPNPEEFSTAWIDALKAFVGEHAGGVLWMSGPQYSMKFLTLARTRGIREILPVTFGNLEAGVLDALGSIQTKQWPLKLRPEGEDHPVLQMSKTQQGVWESLPGVYWSFPAVEAKPGTQCLIEHSNPRLRTMNGIRPLIVTGQFGAGRTMYIGMSGIWRWRRAGVVYYDRFWTQTVRFLLEGRLTAGQRQGRILTDRDTYGAGERIAVSATIYDARFQPLQIEGFSATIHTDKEKAGAVQMKPVAGRPGVYEGSAIAQKLGLNELRATIEDGLAKPLVLSRRFTVEMPNIEFADPRMNKTLLRDIAERSSGTYYDIDTFSEIPAAIRDQREVSIVRERPRMLWDTWRMLGLLVILLTLEWAVRRRFRLL